MNDPNDYMVRMKSTVAEPFTCLCGVKIIEGEYFFEYSKTTDFGRYERVRACNPFCLNTQIRTPADLLRVPPFQEPILGMTLRLRRIRSSTDTTEERKPLMEEVFGRWARQGTKILRSDYGFREAFVLWEHEFQQYLQDVEEWERNRIFEMDEEEIKKKVDLDSTDASYQESLETYFCNAFSNDWGRIFNTHSGRLDKFIATVYEKVGKPTYSVSGEEFDGTVVAEYARLSVFDLKATVPWSELEEGGWERKTIETYYEHLETHESRPSWEATDDGVVVTPEGVLAYAVLGWSEDDVNYAIEEALKEDREEYEN